MITIKQVESASDRRNFVDFPTKLYKKCPYYVHPLRGDELNIFSSKKNVSYDDCEAVYFLAYKDKKLAGRIAGIIQKVYNEKTNEKRVRFTRFDSIDDIEVAKALFSAVENWAKSKGMEKVHGPLGFNDLEREGMLVEGFNELATFEEQYNYEYYDKLLKACGYEKEVDWLEYKVFMPEKTDSRLDALSEKILKRYNLRIAEAKSKRELINKYRDGIFKLLDESYEDLYGVVPLNKKTQDQLISQFKLLIKQDFFVIIVDQKDEVVAFGFAFPSIAKAVQKSKGRLFPFGIFRIFKAAYFPKDVADFCLIGVKKEYLNKGLPAMILKHIINIAHKYNLKYFETNLNLEDNLAIQHQWKNFEHEQHKRRRSYIKNIN